MAETRLITFWEGKSRDEINYLFPFRSYFWRPREAGFNPGILIVCGHEMRWPSAPLVCPSFICGPGSRHKKDWIPALCSSCWQSLSRDFPPPPILWLGVTAGWLLTLWQHRYASRMSPPRGKTSGGVDKSTQLGSSKSSNSGVTCENNCTHLAFHTNIVVLPGEEI